jgi:uncharacterized CHY-type Zn-finger protein
VYRHVDASGPVPSPQPSASEQFLDEPVPARPEPSVTRGLPYRSRDHVSGQRIVATKPVPAAQKADPREFQITQVTRRFSPRRQEEENGTFLELTLTPSDPDFPFELEALQCVLDVPKTYPLEGKPKLRVKNPEIPRGYQINVERGFDSLLEQAPNRTLLSLLNQLDKNLENFLTSEKAQTIKIVANAPKAQHSIKSNSPTAHAQPDAELGVELQHLTAATYTPQQQIDARLKREADVRQLEARMSRVAVFSKAADGTFFNVPVQIPKPARLPVSLRSVKEVTLFVPPLYNLDPCTIKLNSVAGDDARNVEMAFERHARDEMGLTLMAHINYLTQNMHSMATPATVDPASTSIPPAEPTPFVKASASMAGGEDKFDRASLGEDRPHIKVIPRPPEWDLPAGGPSDDSSNDSESDEDFTDSGEDEDGENDGGASLPQTTTAATAAANSIVISFPGVELYGIEVLEVASLSLTLKCDRCKSTVDIRNLKPSHTSNSASVTLTESCPKCATTLTASYHRELIHAYSIKAGHLDLTSCTVSDMSPSTFTPTCSDCSTAYPTPPGVVSVRGESTLSVCRSCHRKMTFKIPEVKFLRVATNASNIPSLPRKRKPKENLGIVTGTPLPKSGLCGHYRKSHRWFRFSCCSKVYPCNRCHDEQAEPKHPNEHANRMICGYCSREQNYRPEDCGVCGRSLIGRRGGGFWEGGKGTRDKAKMSRKDPRKYKRRGGNAPGGA